MKKMSLNTIHKTIWEYLEEGISNSKSDSSNVEPDTTAVKLACSAK